MTIHKTLFVLFFYFLTLTALAQNSPQDEARQAFGNGDYAQALPKFKRLLTLFPKDALYHYYTGVCMVQTNTNLVKSVEYLTFASNKKVPADVFFFLGKAYHLLYRFDEAIEAYRIFKQKGDRQEVDKLGCNHQIEMAENGIKLTGRQSLFDVYQVDTIQSEDLFDYYNKNRKEGSFRKRQVKELPFMKGQTVWRYVSKENRYYESSSVSKNNRDIVVIQKANSGNRQKTENIGPVINTGYDEDYTWFNTADSSLYFSSKGHNSMGGYDIFKSKYDASTGHWSEPVNLGFPINSPYDDILFVPSENFDKVSFASNRNTSGSKFAIYTISYAKDYASAEIAGVGDLISLSNLKIQQAMPSNLPMVHAEDIFKSKTKTQWLSNHKRVSAYPEKLSASPEYLGILSSALRFQVQSDSFFRKADDLRQKALLQDNESEKSHLKREAYSMELKSKEAQKIADEHFEKVKTFESAIFSDDKENENIPVPTDSLAKMAFVTTGHTPPKQSDKISQKSKINSTSSKVIYEFRIMNETPYKQLSDIPVNYELPQDIIFRIQMGAFSKAIEPERFKGIVPIYGETIPGSAVVKYYAGLFNRYSDVEKALNKIREYGFKDAYIVSYYNGKSIPLSRAKEMQKDIK